jgi:hypothetical protein
MVGMFGMEEVRLLLATPSARSFPLRICGALLVGPSNIACTCPRDHVYRRGRAALVRHMHHLQAGFHEEEFHCQMLAAAHADRCVRKLPRVRLDVGEELLEVHRRNRRVHGQVERRIEQHADGSEVLHRIVRQRLLGGGREHHAGLRAIGERMPVRRRFRGRIERNDLARARPVLDDERLPQALAQVFAHDAREGIAQTARRVRNDEADRLGGIALRECAGRCNGEKEGEHPGERHHGILDDYCGLRLLTRSRAAKTRNSFSRLRVAAASSGVQVLKPLPTAMPVSPAATLASR